MKLGVLRTGRPPKPAIERFGTYPDMFRQLLGPDAYDWRTYAVDEGELPARPEECDAYLITGSSAGVYDPLPWIGETMDFLNLAKGKAALVGVCFGHQLMAQAFGGTVVKSPKGWGVGEQVYEILAREPWMDEPPLRIRLPASHQDQVVEIPPGAEVFAASEFTPYAGLAWRDQPAISIQPHPEFDPAYAVSLIEHRRGDRYSDEQANAAVASYSGADDRLRVAGWIKRFLAHATS
ncbi:MAG TPA: type 1 glutamine amidotransferase [Phenylobacterium sp.]|uniref:glutamine amidotransferase-related protein n=1 Tax=Phenylobacterium sp. TaxID=1871053 RepID=UPI002BE13EC2|nr:type 1 glutamine amidotransferase [Phenylobacterium sp.]HSV03485.1 type 1 glutamine amidotransferase [Phenylobacterium sp.]